MTNHSRGWTKYVIGWGLIILGVLLLLEKLGLVTGSLLTFWPILVILIGVGMLVKRR
jgi:hypothetical protein